MIFTNSYYTNRLGFLARFVHRLCDFGSCIASNAPVHLPFLTHVVSDATLSVVLLAQLRVAKDPDPHRSTMENLGMFFSRISELCLGAQGR